MTRNEFLQLVKDRDEAHERYVQAKLSRDHMRDEATKSLSEHRLKLVEVAQLHADADQIKADSLARHRAAILDRTKTEQACEELWREYRSLDKRVPEARLEMLGLGKMNDHDA